MPITVKWGNDAFQFDLPAEDTRIAAVRHSIAAYTHLPYDAFKLVHDGAVMVDDNAPSIFLLIYVYTSSETSLVSLYHIRSNSTIAVVTLAEEPASFKATERAQIASIDAELAVINTTLLPAHAQFLARLSPQTRTALASERSRLSELLLQALLRIDAIVPDRDWANARAHRKTAVNHLQSLLDQLDSAWGSIIVT